MSTRWLQWKVDIASGEPTNGWSIVLGHNDETLEVMPKETARSMRSLWQSAPLLESSRRSSTTMSRP